MAESKKDRIERVLTFAAGTAAPGSRVKVTENADGSIDGEILVRNEKGWIAAENTLVDLQSTLVEHEIGGAYVSAGFRLDPRRPGIKDESPFERYHGLGQKFSQYYNYNRGTPTATAIAIEIMESLKKKRFTSPQQIVLRVYWKHGERPPQGWKRGRKR